MYLRDRTWLESGPRPRARCGNRGLSSFSSWCNSGAPTANAFETVTLMLPSLLCPLTGSGVVLAGTNASIPPPPAPQSPSLLPATAATPGAVFAGNDSTGQPTYVVQQTPGETQAQYAGEVQDFMNAQPVADSSSSPWLLLGAVLGGFVLIGMFAGGRGSR